MGFRVNTIDMYVLPISDCHLVPINDYRLWQNIRSLPVTVISITSRQSGEQVDVQTDRPAGRQTGRQTGEKTGRQADRQADR